MVWEVASIEKRPQGNTDANSNWAKARHRFVVQMLVRLGDDPDLDEFLLADGAVVRALKTVVMPQRVRGLSCSTTQLKI